MLIKDRIKELRRVPARELLPNPKNWRKHPRAQQDALRGILAEVGFADALLARETPDGLMLIDGHLRAETAPDSQVPVLVLDLTAEEADKLLATLDPLAALAELDAEALQSLMDSIKWSSDDLAATLKPLWGGTGGSGGAGAGTGGPSLSDRFGWPPFSVFDARQGAWQERKRQWLALGIQSELGRGESAGLKLTMSETVQRLKPTADQALKNSRRNASPGGSPRPAMKLGKDGRTVRGDGRGRPLA